jgi:transposase
MAPWLLAAAYEACARWQHIGADMAYRGQRLRTWGAEGCGGTLESVARPRRWVVERTLAGVGRDRRRSKEYAYLLESRATMMSGALTRLMLRRLARQAPYGVARPQRQGLRGLARAF